MPREASKRFGEKSCISLVGGGDCGRIRAPRSGVVAGVGVGSSSLLKN
jgi:hypothetical protein